MIYSVFLLIFTFCYPSEANIPRKYLNVPLEKQNPSSVNPPMTDARTIPPFKYPFAFVHKAESEGGWVRAMTRLDLPVAVTFQGSQVRLEANAIRELHWHDCAEFGFVFYGDARVTAVDPSGNSFVNDVNATDIWYFPRGYPHSEQGTGPDGTFFLQVFDCGDFSATSTYNLLDWLNHLPLAVLATNFEAKKSIFNNIKMDKVIFPGQPPRPLAVEQAQTANGTGTVPQPFTFKTSSIPPQVVRTGGTAKLILQSIFPVMPITLVLFTLYPGGINELHWHPNADEWQYYISGNGRMNVFGADGRSRTMDFTSGDVGYVQANAGHYIQNTGSADLVFLALLRTPGPQTVTLSQWLAHEPSRLVDDHIGTGEAFINSINETLAFIEPF